jgi:predicted secreted protein
MTTERKPRTVIVACHCILNPSAKVLSPDTQAQARETALRRRAFSALLEREIDILQLPCPEFTLYGPLRWGHVREQFDNAFFRGHCRRILEPATDQIAEYAAHPELFELLGIVGVDGSPSCGVNKTCTGDWGGEWHDGTGGLRMPTPAREAEGRGVFMEELLRLLCEKGLMLPVFSLETLPTWTTENSEE